MARNCLSLVSWLAVVHVWAASAPAEPPRVVAEPPRVVAEEVREFEICVRDQASGRSIIRIAELDDGSVVAATDVSAAVSFVVFRYRYEFHGCEKWQNGRLLQLDNRAVDNGKPLAVRARVDPAGSTIYVRGQAARPAPALAMTTNYWQLPKLAPSERTLAIMDADRGVMHSARLERIGPEELVGPGRQVFCTHYRLTGTTAADLWFDAEGRLVRQRTVELGYPVELRLIRIVKNPASAPPATSTVLR